MFKFTKAFGKFLKQQTKKLRFEETGTLKNGVVVKEDDILILKNSIGLNIYKKVKFIRKTPDGIHEGSFGDGFYILENTEGEVFDVSNPEFDGIKVNKKDKYLLLHQTQEVPFIAGSVVKFTSIDTDNYGKLTLQFHHTNKSVRRDPYRFSLNKRNTGNLYTMDDVKPLPPLYRCGRRVFVNRKSGSVLSKGTTFGTPYGLVYENAGVGLDKPNVGEVKKYILQGDHFHIESFDMDIDFAIGDKVIVADWVNPVNMLSIKLIQGFKIDDKTGDITFVLSDKQGNLHQEKYYDGSYGYVFVGRIRKVANQFGKIIAGTKIKAKDAGVPHFPKKDTNIIIGFLTDTDGPDPLVLCSNCCTLWYSDVVKNFTKTTMKNKKWQLMKHAPIDVAKIKYQPGDIIQGTSDYKSKMAWLVFKNSGGGGGLKILDFNFYTSWPDYFTLDRYISANSRFDCIPNPRIGPKAQTDAGLSKAWPNLHGHYFTCDKSIFQFINDERSMVNVQSSSK